MKNNRKPISKVKRESLLEEWGHRCAYCGVTITLKTLQVDQGIPLVLQDSVSLLGKFAQLPSLDLNDPWNLFPACRECNNWKGGMTIKQFRIELGKQVDRCHEYSRNFRIAFRFGMLDVIRKSADFLMDSKVGMGITEFDANEARIRYGNQNCMKVK